MLRTFSIGMALLEAVSSALVASAGEHNDGLAIQVLCGVLTVLPAGCWAAQKILGVWRVT